jgi:hypothetical protein
MRFKLHFLFFAGFLCFANLASASFPVERTKATSQLETVEYSTEVLTSPAAAAWSNSQTVAILLWFFLGGLAGHRWYLGSPIGWNILFILTAGFLVVGWVIDGIDIITGNYPGL